MDTLQQLEGLTFATALDLNMGYYTIPLAESSKQVTTIVTEFGKFRYTCVLMGMVISGHVFISKMYNLIGNIEGVKTYIDDILCIGKGSFCTTHKPIGRDLLQVSKSRTESQRCQM